MKSQSNSTIPETLSPESHKRLLRVLEDVARDTEDDAVDPSQAIAKRASDSKVPHGHVHFLVNAYNTGRAAAQRQSSDDVWDKSADYPMANTSKVLQFMFPDRYKSASEIKKQQTVSSEYLLPPSWVNRQNEALLEKYAGIMPKTGTGMPGDSLAPKSMIKRREKPQPGTKPLNYVGARQELDRLKKVASQASSRSNYAKDLARESRIKLAEYFTRPGSEPFNAVRTNCSSLYGEEAVKLLDSLVMPARFKKSASTEMRKVQGSVYHDIQDHLELQKAVKLLEDDHLTKKAHFETRVEELATQFSPGPVDPILGVAIPGLRPPLIKAAFMGMSKDIAKSLMTTSEKNPVMSLAPSPSSSGANNVERKLMDHVSSLESQASLADLMAGDEVLRQHDPNEIVKAYNSIRSMAPVASTNQEILRAVLRDRMSKGHQSLFDIDALTKIEKNLAASQRSSGGEEY